MKKTAFLILSIFSIYCSMGQSDIRTGESRTIDSLLKILKKGGHDTLKLRLLSAIITNINDDNVWPQYNRQMKELAEKNLATDSPKAELIIYRKFLAESINNLGYLEEQKGNVTAAIGYYMEALKQFETIKYTHGIAEAYNNIAVFYDGQGNIEKALEFHAKSLKLKENTSDSVGWALSLNNIGMTYQKQGMIEKAIEYFSRSLTIKERIGNKNGMAFTLNNLGFIFQNQGEIPKAKEYYEKSLKLWREVDNKDGIVTAYNNLAWVYLLSKDTVKALEYYSFAEKLGIELNDKQAMATSNGNIGMLLFDKGDINGSLVYLNKAETLYEEINDKDGMASILIYLSKIYAKQGNIAEAEKACKRSLKFGEELSYPDVIAKAADLLRLIYKRMGKYKEALEMNELADRMNDSISNETTRKASIKQQFKYEYEKKAIADSLKSADQLARNQIKHEEEIKQQRIYTYGGIVGFVLMIVVASVSFRAYRNKQKANTIINAQKTEVEHQKHIIEEKQKEIVDSINYAKRIQYTLLAHDQFLKENLPEHFVYFKPKDIVSGDFYWATKKDDRFYLAVCDSTGHGVPGAFMSLLNIGFLTEAINEKGIVKPNMVFDHVRQRLIEGISKEGQRDGFDGILICIDKKKKDISYAAANNSPIIIRNGELVELPGDKMPVGIGERTDPFNLYEIKTAPGEMLILYTDGYADQFGGPKGKKFKYKPLNQLLLSNATLPLEKQNELLNVTFENWKGNLEQVDDVCVIGIKM